MLRQFHYFTFQSLDLFLLPSCILKVINNLKRNSFSSCFTLSDLNGWPFLLLTIELSSPSVGIFVPSFDSSFLKLRESLTRMDNNRKVNESGQFTNGTNYESVTAE